ncbi:c-type cytochrome [Membranihabitans marinus]|uniref:c-type cytochrome n=1 Tax=Membranihabitans marinus TaxID=1227546 RepID=UPI001F000940|nr:c-type cytochrome [Membranihabitans marinus]
MKLKLIHNVAQWSMLSLFLAAILLSCEESTVSEAIMDPKIEKLSIPEGFVAEHIFAPIDSVNGSWVSMTFDDKGRLIASDQYGGLFRLTIPAIGSEDVTPQVEKLDVNMGCAQGLLWAFNSLYVMVNNKVDEDDDEEEIKQTSGFYRLQDTNGDDSFDKITQLKEMVGWGEHGPHSVRLAPDGKSLFVIAGNHTDIPEMDSYRVPPIWGEDNLFPDIKDPRGHAADRKAPGGWVANVDPEGKHWELYCVGFRNPFDIAFNERGDMFTYDSDMEWDLGTPWYRPTRICQVVSGGEYGWRTGTGKWRPEYPDNLPGIINLGQGSPTGVFHGKNAKFPDKYKRALYAFDWSFGIIYAMHMTPNGASYTAQAEEFISGLPLPLTDGVIGPDGALYFMTGGRRLESDLYRVYHKDHASFSTEALPLESPEPEAHAIKTKLETYHTEVGAEAVDFAWPYLTHDDRFVRFAARLAIEHQPVALWQDRVWSEESPEAAILGAVALSRQGSKSIRNKIFSKLLTIDFSSLTIDQKIDWTRAVELTTFRLGEPLSGVKSQLISYIDAEFPANEERLDRQLSKLMIHFQAPSAVGKTLALLDDAKNSKSTDYQNSSELILRNPQYGLDIGEMLNKLPPAQQTYYAMMLSKKSSGWTDEERTEYFSWFQNAFSFKGGNSYVGFVNKARKAALEYVPSSKRDHFNEISGDSLVNDKGLGLVAGVHAKGPGKNWKVDQALDSIAASTDKRDFENGKNMFSAALCITCHTMAGEGSNVGPDLTQLGTRFSQKDILEKIIEPNSAISDQYASSVFELKNGSSVVARISREDDDNYYVSQNPYAPTELRTIAKSEVAKVKKSAVSMMPPRLINSLNPDELRDLMAFLMSGGNKNNELFTQEAVQ